MPIYNPVYNLTNLDSAPVLIKMEFVCVWCSFPCVSVNIAFLNVFTLLHDTLSQFGAMTEKEEVSECR